jgi:SAM-dependent methyltransferase
VFDRVLSFGVGVDQGRILDLGTGTGSLARGFAKRGHSVIGLDVDSALLAEARRTDLEHGLETDYVRSAAETVPFTDGTFRVVTAGQCWHWFDRDRTAVEVRRVLVPGGELVITHFDWLPIPDTVVAATEALILEWNPDWRGAGGYGLYPPWLRDVRKAGFEDVETFSFDVDVPYTHEAWRGRIRASAGVGGLPEANVASFDDALADLLSTHFPAEPLTIPHRSFTLICRKPT